MKILTQRILLSAIGGAIVMISVKEGLFVYWLYLLYLPLGLVFIWNARFTNWWIIIDDNQLSKGETK